MACSACEKAKALASGVVGALSLSKSNYYIGILQSYGVSANPTDDQIELATERSKACLNCPHIRHFEENSVKGEIISFISDNFANEKVKELETNYSSCSACGCPLFAKVFADTTNPSLDCPKGFWKV